MTAPDPAPIYRLSDVRRSGEERTIATFADADEALRAAHALLAAGAWNVRVGVVPAVDPLADAATS